MQKNSQEQGTVVKGQRAKVYSGEVRDKRFGDECGRRVQHLWRGGGQIVQWRCTCRRSPRRESQCYDRGGSSNSESCQEL